MTRSNGIGGSFGFALSQIVQCGDCAADRRDTVVRMGTTEDPRPAAVTFVTTEHFTLQGSRAATISESTGRANMFLSSVSGGLVALGLVATATHVGDAFFAFGLVLLPLLAFLGGVTFERVLQTGIEDRGYARRIARLRAYYFDYAPELLPYLLSVEPAERMVVQGLSRARWQGLRTVAGMVGVVTAALTASAAGLGAIVLSGHSLPVSVATGGVVFVVLQVWLMRYQRAAWRDAGAVRLNIDVDA